MPSGIIEKELALNESIEKEVACLFRNKHKTKAMFDLSMVEKQENHTFLNMKDQPNRLIPAAMKLIKYYDVRMVDFTNTRFRDDNMK